MRKILRICFILLLVVNQTAYSKYKKQKHQNLKNSQKQNLRSYVLNTEQQFGLPTSLLSAVIEHESSFNEKAINPVNSGNAVASYGLGQITIPTAKDFCNIKTKKELLQHDTNIQCTAKILKSHITRYGNVQSALAAYRAGTPCKKRYKHKYRICTYSDDKYVNGILKRIKKSKEFSRDRSNKHNTDS